MRGGSHLRLDDRNASYLDLHCNFGGVADGNVSVL